MAGEVQAELEAAQRRVRTFLTTLLAANEALIVQQRSRAGALPRKMRGPMLARLDQLEADANRAYRASVVEADRLLASVAKLAKGNTTK